MLTLVAIVLLVLAIRWVAYAVAPEIDPPTADDYWGTSAGWEVSHPEA